MPDLINRLIWHTGSHRCSRAAFLHDDIDIVLDPLVWNSPSVPPLTAANPAVIVDLLPTGSGTELVYTNIALASDNAVEVADTPADPWANYGLRGTGSGGVFTALVAGVDNDTEMYRIVTPGPEAGITTWSPNPVPPAGGAVTVSYNQNQKNLAGVPDVQWRGANPDPGTEVATNMVFDGDGQWHIDLTVAPATNVSVRFKVTDPANTLVDRDGGSDYFIKVGGRATWTPERPVAGQVLTVNYDATGGPLTDRNDVNIWWGVDGYEGSVPGWNGSPGTPMNNVTTNMWTIDLNVPPTAKQTVNFVFNAGPTPPGGTTAWDSGGGDYKLFIETSP